MLVHTIGNARIWRRVLTGYHKPFVVGVSARISDGVWTPVREEFYESKTDWLNRYEELVRGFEEGRYRIYYATQEDAYFAAIQQKAYDRDGCAVWLWRIYDLHSAKPASLKWCGAEWSIPFDERSEEADDCLYWQLYVENAPAEARA